MQLRQRQVEGAIVVDLSGDGIGSEPSTLKELITSVLARGHRNIVLNVEHLQNMDSTGLAEIVASFKAAAATGGTLKIAGASGHVRRLLQVTKVDTFVIAYPSEAEALASFDVAQTRTS